MRRELFAGLYTVHKSVDLVFKMIGSRKDGGEIDQCTVFRAIDGEVFAVLQADTTLGADKVDVHFSLKYVLRPSTVEVDDGTLGTDQTRDHFLHVVGAVGDRRARPHTLIDVFGYVLAQLREGLGRDGLRCRIAAAVHYDIEEMHAPVDEHAAACDLFGGEGTAQSRNGTVGAEADIGLHNIAQLAGLNIIADAVDRGVKAVADTDDQRHTRLVLYLLHFQRLGIGTGGGLFAQNVLACTHGGNGNLAVHLVGGTDGNGLHLGISEHFFVINDGGAATVVFYSLFGALGDDVAEVLDLGILVLHIGGDVSIVGNGAAADHRNDDFAHKRTSSVQYYTIII